MYERCLETCVFIVVESGLGRLSCWGLAFVEQLCPEWQLDWQRASLVSLWSLHAVATRPGQACGWQGRVMK